MEEDPLDHLRDPNNQVNDSFNEILKKIRARTNNKVEELSLLTQRIMRDFVIFESKKTLMARDEKSLKMKESAKVAHPLDVNIPKKKRAARKKIVQVRPDTINVHNKSSKKKSPKRCIEIEEEKPRRSKKPKRRNNVNFAELGPETQHEIPEEFKNRILAMNGHDWVFLIQKELYRTDMNLNNNRLSMPALQVTNEFLREDEKMVLDNEGGIMVRMIEPCFDEIDLELKKWPMGRSFSYNLKKNWHKVFEKKKNMLQENTTVQVWAFRIGLKLCCALVVKHGEKDSGASTSRSPDIASSSTCTTLPGLKEQE